MTFSDFIVSYCLYGSVIIIAIDVRIYSQMTIGFKRILAECQYFLIMKNLEFGCSWQVRH